VECLHHQRQHAARQLWFGNSWAGTQHFAPSVIVDADSDVATTDTMAAILADFTSGLRR